MRDTADQPEPAAVGWSLVQRRALLVLLAVFLLALVARLALDRQFVSNPQPAHGARYDELASRIDPNSADWQTLSAIPTLGERRAKAIVAYREQAQSQGSTPPAFRNPKDLLRVRGIGQATIENLRPYLIFPSDQPATSQ